MPSAWGRAELRAGAAAVAIGLGSPVARLGADEWRRREARAAVGAVGAVDAVCALGAGAAVVAEGVGGVETRPLARPRRERERSHSTPPSRDDGGVERRQCRGARQLCQPPGVIQEIRWPHGGHGDCASGSARDVDASGSARWLDLKAGRRQASRRQAPRPGAAEDPGETPGTSVDPSRETISPLQKTCLVEDDPCF